MYAIYAGYFAAEGILYPFWPAWLQSLGYGTGEVALFIAAAYWPQVPIGYGIGILADYRRNQLGLSAYIGLLSAFTIVMMYFVHGKASILALCMCYGGLWATVLPLTETYLLGSHHTTGQDYGAVRAVGSLSFILVTVGAGFVLNATGTAAVPGLAAGSMLLTGLACRRLQSREAIQPREAIEPPPSADAATIRRMAWQCLRRRDFVVMLGSSACIQLSHSLYFATASNIWADHGYSTTWIGIFWAVAVIAEIAMFYGSRQILNRWSIRAVMMASGIGAAGRWLLFTRTDIPGLVIAEQSLHALSFACYHMALMRFVRDNAPASARTSIQTFYYSFIVALPMGLFTPFAGWLYDRVDLRAYLVMSLVALLGAGIAALHKTDLQRRNT